MQFSDFTKIKQSPLSATYGQVAPPAAFDPTQINQIAQGQRDAQTAQSQLDSQNINSAFAKWYQMNAGNRLVSPGSDAQGNVSTPGITMGSASLPGLGGTQFSNPSGINTAPSPSVLKKTMPGTRLTRGQTAGGMRHAL